MNIKVQTGLILAICTITGYVLGFGLVLWYQSIEVESYQLGPNAGVIKDAARLQSLTGQWLLSTDLVLNGGESFMVRAADRQAGELADLLDDLRGTSLAADFLKDLGDIGAGVRRIQALLDQSVDLHGVDRVDRLHELAGQCDEISMVLVRKVENIESGMLSKSEALEKSLAERRSTLGLLVWFSAGTYCLVIILAWAWTVRTMVDPIADLSRAAERAQTHDEPFVLDERGPQEVRLLTKNISSFVSSLQHAQEKTEEEVRERTEELSKANQAKSEFLATMSHELRTPLNGVINMNELILQTGLDQTQREYARIAKNAADALLGLINDILDFSKIEAGMLELERATIEVRDFVEDVVDIVSGAADAKGIELAGIVRRDVPGVATGDPMRLRQIVMNLLNNAVKFTDDGKVVLRVSTIRLSGQGESPLPGARCVLLFEVEDTGIGIPEDRKDALFKAFVQLDASTTRRYGGSGLGLAICKTLTELMGGEIGVDSVVDKGSRFWFTVSLECIAKQPALHVPENRRHRHVIVWSLRGTQKEQLIEYVRSLGFAPESVVAPLNADLSDVPLAFWEGASSVFAILDPRGHEQQTRHMIDTLRVLGDRVDLRVCVMESLLRSRAPGGESWPESVEVLRDPVRFRQLRAWFGQDALGRGRATSPEPGIGEVEIVPRKTGRILVAEDNKINQRVVVTILKRAGFECIAVEDGQAAIDYVSAHPCDLILMDCQMPVMDGWHCTRVIRKLESTGQLADGCPKRLPIVALTANAMEGDRERCLRVGMDEYLTKPIRPDLLLDTLDSFLRGPGRALVKARES